MYGLTIGVFAFLWYETEVMFLCLMVLWVAWRVATKTLVMKTGHEDFVKQKKNKEVDCYLLMAFWALFFCICLPAFVHSLR